MSKPLSHFLLLAPLLLVGCNTGSAGQGNAANDEDYQRQVDTFDRQMERGFKNLAEQERQTSTYDVLLARSERQYDRFDKILAKWEEQARRTDAILNAQEKSAGITP